MRDSLRRLVAPLCRPASLRFGLALAGVLASAPARAEEASRIQDNLFLLEEAYNQEPGVIQHISVFQAAPSAGEWSYTFGEEWPVFSQLHQVSVGLGFSGATADGGAKGMTDALLNYRYQAMGLAGSGTVSFAPRASLVLPTGNARQGLGRGAMGLQVNLPVSIELGRSFALHVNAGATLTPEAESPTGRTDTALDANAGVAFVWQPLSWCDPFVELAYTSTAEVNDDATTRTNALVVSPAARFAIDAGEGGLQIVPGVALPITVVPTSEVDASVIGYLSFEHPSL